MLAVTHVLDISDRKQSDRRLQHLADHDALTGLFNRRRFTEELDRALRQAKRFDETRAVLFLDLDGFKFVNDTLGHAAGDELIRRVADLLSGELRETDTLGRIGGDEFSGEIKLSPDELVVEADIAMYDAKEAGKDRFPEST